LAEVRLEKRGNVALVTLAAGERRNALTETMVREFEEVCEQVDADSGLGALVLAAEGKSWCSGAHRDLLAGVEDDPTDPKNFDALAMGYAAFLRFGAMKVPTIAAIHGHVVGAGVNLMMAADLRIIANDAQVITGFQKIGIHPGGGHFMLIARAAGQEVAAALSVFGETINGAQAVEYGLAWKALPSEEVLGYAMTAAERTAADPGLARMTVKSLRQELGPPMLPWGAALELERSAQMWSLRRRKLLGAV
jgi:enoyl-CoA hydratase